MRLGPTAQWRAAALGDEKDDSRCTPIKGRNGPVGAHPGRGTARTLAGSVRYDHSTIQHSPDSLFEALPGRAGHPARDFQRSLRAKPLGIRLGVGLSGVHELEELLDRGVDARLEGVGVELERVLRPGAVELRGQRPPAGQAVEGDRQDIRPRLLLGVRPIDSEAAGAVGDDIPKS